MKHPKTSGYGKDTNSHPLDPFFFLHVLLFFYKLFIPWPATIYCFMITKPPPCSSWQICDLRTSVSDGIMSPNREHLLCSVSQPVSDWHYELVTNY